MVFFLTIIKIIMGYKYIFIFQVRCWFISFRFKLLTIVTNTILFFQCLDIITTIKTTSKRTTNWDETKSWRIRDHLCLVPPTLMTHGLSLLIPKHPVLHVEEDIINNNKKTSTFLAYLILVSANSTTNSVSRKILFMQVVTTILATTRILIFPQ